MKKMFHDWFLKDPPSQTLDALLNLWWIPALVPLCMALSSLINSTWSWGLMDDHVFAFSPLPIWGTFVEGIHSLLKTGRFFPVFNFHTALFYHLFRNHPHAFFFFRWTEVVATLSIWAYLSSVITKSKIAVPLLIAITLSFYKFYDAFFFLSTQEILGSFFTGFTILFFYRAFEPLWEASGQIRKTPLILGSVMLLLTFMSKESFVSIGIALGGALIASWVRNRQLKKILIVGMCVLLFSILYALTLKFGISKGYSASYTLTDLNKIAINAKLWGTKVLLNHSPWIIMALIILIFTSKTQSSPALFFGRIVGIFIYAAYALIILPWSSWGHYVTPLAIFFAFGITLFLINRLNKIPSGFLIIVISISTLLNTAIGGHAINFHEKYQYDTSNIQQWMAQNAIFQHEVVAQGATVRCNAFEPAYALPRLTNRYYGTKINDFIFTPTVKNILMDRNTKYYLYNPTAGDQDLRRLGNMWTPVFLSDHWILFRRMIY